MSDTDVTKKKLCFFLNGRQASGKSTLRKTIVSAANRFGIHSDSVRFSEPLYSAHDWIIEEGCQISGDAPPAFLGDDDPDRRYKNGDLLQRLGDLMRLVHGEDVLIRGAISKIRREFDLPDPWLDVLIVEDGRLPGELESVRAACEKYDIEFVSIRLECPEHIRKERALARGTSTWRENTGHRTEVGLDGHMDYFDHVIDTSAVGLDGMRDFVFRFLDARYVNRVPDRFHALAQNFTRSLRDLEEATGCGANFRWSYDGETGKKRLEVADVATLVPPTDERVQWAKSEVPGILEKATKELVNDDPGRA